MVETTNTKTNKTTTDTYEYTDSDWKDLLTSYNGTAITYDAVGNPLSYNNGTAWKFTWENAHDLATAKGNGKSISYHYDMDGVRDSKTVDGVKYEYITQGGNVTLERWNDGEEKSLEFIYDNGGAPYSVIYSRGNEVDTYYYILNQQGDVIRIVDTSGKTVSEYTYNGWGKILNVSNAKGSEIGTINPILYRGYYYDSELNMYYLQSRYYDPVMKRMIASDDQSLIDEAGIKDNNLFSYCDNEPIARQDEEGEYWHVAIGFAVGAGIDIAYQMVVERKSLSRVNWTSVATSGISSAVGATSLKVGGQMLVNAALGAANKAAEDRGKHYSRKRRIVNIAVAATSSALAAKIGGDGTNKNKVFTKAAKNANKKISREARRANVKVAMKRIASHKAYKVSIKKSFTRAHVSNTLHGYAAGKSIDKVIGMLKSFSRRRNRKNVRR